MFSLTTLCTWTKSWCGQPLFTIKKPKLALVLMKPMMLGKVKDHQLWQKEAWLTVVRKSPPPPHWASSCVFSPKLLGLHILSLCPFHLFLVKTFKIFYSSYFKIGNIYKTLVTRSYNRTLVHFPTRAFDPSHAFLASTKSEIVLFVFCSWLISLNFMSFWLIQVAPDDMILPFWCLNNKYVVYMYHVFFAHLCGLILVFWLLWTVLQSTWKWRHLRNHWGHWKTIWWAIFLSSSHFSFALVAVHFCCTH